MAFSRWLHQTPPRGPSHGSDPSRWAPDEVPALMSMKIWPPSCHLTQGPNPPPSGLVTHNTSAGGPWPRKASRLPGPTHRWKLRARVKRRSARGTLPHPLLTSCWEAGWTPTFQPVHPWFLQPGHLPDQPAGAACQSLCPGPQVTCTPILHRFRGKLGEDPDQSSLPGSFEPTCPWETKADPKGCGSYNMEHGKPGNSGTF